MGQQLSSKLLFIYSPNSDGFYIVYISQGSVATQLRCVGMFSNHFTTNFSRNAAVKNFENRSIIGKDMEETYWLTFLGPPCSLQRAAHNRLACTGGVKLAGLDRISFDAIIHANDHVD